METMGKKKKETQAGEFKRISCHNTNIISTLAQKQSTPPLATSRLLPPSNGVNIDTSITVNLSATVKQS